ncbi:MAG TPA: carbamate kinase [Thermoanaerobaculia bacterium]|nr:carbamate kinase [Thermoanaerobaculia bacterium]
MTSGARVPTRASAPRGSASPPPPPHPPLPPPVTSRPLAVVAFGGNALLRPDDDGTVEEQLRRADEAAGWLVELARRGHDLVVVHGNGPQVGQVMIQMEEAATKIPPATLDVAVAQTEGGVGYLLELALRNRLWAEGLDREVSTLLSLVVVDRGDPAFAAPSKPVGPFFSRYRADFLQRHLGWQMIEDSGRGWRKVVASPRPVEILGVPAVSDLLGRGNLVIAGGGGGIPVVRERDGRLAGIEAVIDKDRTSALLARELAADLFIVLTGVARVMKNFGRKNQQPLPVLPLSEARRLLDRGQFPAGSMGPKIESSIEFVAATGRKALITDIAHLTAALAGASGTLVVPDPPHYSARSAAPRHPRR